MKMKKQLDIKKLLLLNMPYILMGLFATNFGEGWRMAVGADASAKMLSFFSTLPVALASWWPSLHPLDLLVGLCCGAGPAIGRVSQKQERQEVPARYGVWQRPLECIILSVKELYMDAQEDMHMNDYNQNHSPLLPSFRRGRGQGRRREQQHTEPENLFGELRQRAAADEYPALHRRR